MDKQLKITPIQDWFPGIKRPVIISGPCSAESEEQMLTTCKQLADTGKVDILRAGVWKPRTRPNSFEGVGSIGLKWLQKAKEETGLKTAVEVANIKHVYEALKHGVDILWIGARTTVNPFSVQEIADALQGIDATVLVKNPINADLELWIGAIERIYKAGITKIGAIHRGFSKYGETKYRNAPQWQIPIELKRRIPEVAMICDPSHICGNREMLEAVSQEAMDLNYEGLMIESHCDPSVALSDAKQQVTPERFKEIVTGLVLRKDKLEGKEAAATIEMLREEIDHFDDEILHLLSKRMEVAENIGRYKKEKGMTILQTDRWNHIIQDAMEKGQKFGLSEEFIERYLKAVHQESINHQNEVMNVKDIPVEN